MKQLGKHCPFLSAPQKRGAGWAIVAWLLVGVLLLAAGHESLLLLTGHDHDHDACPLCVFLHVLAALVLLAVVIGAPTHPAQRLWRFTPPQRATILRCLPQRRGPPFFSLPEHISV